MTALPKNWSYARLDEVATIVRGLTYSSKDVLPQDSPQAIRLLRATNIQNGVLDLEDPVWVPRALVKPHQLLSPGDILIASSSGSIQIVGKSASVKAQLDATFGAFCTTVRAKEIEPGYLAHYLQDPTLRQNWSDLAGGSNINNLKSTDIAATLIPVPSLDEQKRIVETLNDHLSRLDKALADVDHADNKTLVLRRSILHQLLTPTVQSVKIGLSPDKKASGWRSSLLGDLVDVLDSKRIPLSAAERRHRAGNVPYYGATGQVGTIDKSLFDEPLILLGEDGVQFFDANKPKAYSIDGPSWVNNHAHVLRPKPDSIAFRFLLHYLNIFDYHGYANGTTRLKLTQGAMNSIPVVLPPLEEQHRIGDSIEESLSKLDSTRMSIARQKISIQTLRRSLFNKAFNGKLGTN